MPRTGIVLTTKASTPGSYSDPLAFSSASSAHTRYVLARLSLSLPLTNQIFLFSITGILLCDYYIVQKGKIDLKSLYTAERDGNYWYTYGVNWRAMVAYVVGAAINFVGCK